MKPQFFWVIIVSAVTSFAVATFLPDKSGNSNVQQTTDSMTSLDTAISNSKIRCGYISYQPAAFHDETGKLKGVFVEAMEKAGENLGLEIEWIEGNWPDLLPNLISKRWDAYCSAAWKNSSRIKAADFSNPLYYSYLSVWGNAEKLASVSLDALNSEGYTVAVLDGDTSMTVADQQFPNAKRQALTELNSYSDIFDSIVSGRADFTIAEASFVKQYNASSESRKLSQIGGQPIQIYPNVMMFRKEDHELRRMISSALEELVNQGFVDSLIEKYAKDEVLATAKPYSQSSQ